MLTVRTKKVLAPAILSSGLLILLMLGATRAATGSSVPSLSAADLHILGITSATDVTSIPDQSLPALSVTRAQAIAVAKAEVGRTDSDVRVLLGTAPRYVGEPDRSVWIVMFNGGVSPFDGPAGVRASPITYGVTGVIVDDQTGQMLSGFMH